MDSVQRVAVFAPAPLLTVTVEALGDEVDVHLHAGGQGVWVARMAASLGVEVTLCCALGGESGQVLRALLPAPHLHVAAVEAGVANGVYVHDRREGKRHEIAVARMRPLGRHEVDALYGVAVTAALDSDVALLTGTQPSGVVAADVYGRLTRDLRRNGIPVIADLTGDALDACLAGGLDLAKLSEEEFAAQLGLSATDPGAARQGLERLMAAGARTAVVTRGEHPAYVLTGDPPVLLEVAGPHFDAVDPSGTGDSMMAAIMVALAAGGSVVDALRLGAAAGALNATRRGLGTGSREEIERLAGHVDVREVAPVTRG